MKAVLIAALSLVAPLHSYAQTHAQIDAGAAFDCANYYGLNICAAGPGAPGGLPQDLRYHWVDAIPGVTIHDLADGQLTHAGQGHGDSAASAAPQDRIFDTHGEANPAARDDIFNSTDSFRAYFKTLSSTNDADSESEFLLTTKILDSGDVDLDCRLATHSISKFSDSNYYDCALQKHF